MDYNLRWLNRATPESGLPIQVFIGVDGADLLCAMTLRKAGIACGTVYGKDINKALRRADKLKADWFIWKDSQSEGYVSKRMSNGEQEFHETLDELVEAFDNNNLTCKEA